MSPARKKVQIKQADVSGMDEELDAAIQRLSVVNRKVGELLDTLHPAPTGEEADKEASPPSEDAPADDSSSVDSPQQCGEDA